MLQPLQKAARNRATTSHTRTPAATPSPNGGTIRVVVIVLGVVVVTNVLRVPVPVTRGRLVQMNGVRMKGLRPPA